MSENVKKVIGVRQVDYDRKQDNKHVHGVLISVATPYKSGEGVGFACAEYYINNANAVDYPIGDIVTLTFDVGYSGKAVCTGVVYAK